MENYILLTTSILVSIITFSAIYLAFTVNKLRNKIAHQKQEIEALLKMNKNSAKSYNPMTPISIPIDNSMPLITPIPKIRLNKILEACAKAYETKLRIQNFFKEVKIVGDTLSLDLKTLRQTKNDTQAFINLTMELSYLAAVSSEAIEATHSLKEEYKNLDADELQVASLLLNNLKTKEIASILGINYKRVEFLRSKLRKKLDLKTEDSITTFIANVHKKRVERINRIVTESLENYKKQPL